jgi:hypothetical protein
MVMDAGTRTQLITVAATLGGVVLTLVANAYLERRRARDTRELESLRLASERDKWLRDERVRAYAGLSTAGEEVVQFIRSELPMLVDSTDAGQRDRAEARWSVLRTDLRKAYNQVALFGADDARAAALDLWRTARNVGNDFLRDLQANAACSDALPDLAEQIRSGASRVGTVGERFLEACRTDLQSH